MQGPGCEGGKRTTGTVPLDIIHRTGRLLATGFIASSRAQLVFRLGVFAGVVDGVFAGVLGDILC